MKYSHLPEDEDEQRSVCEVGYLQILGISMSTKISASPRQWRNCKKRVMDNSTFIESDPYDRPWRKFEHAKAYMLRIGVYGAETSPFAGEKQFTGLACVRVVVYLFFFQCVRS